jgi:hypothetical protein
MKVEIPRFKIGKRQKLETPIDEEALLLVKYLRDEQKSWFPRIAKLGDKRKLCFSKNSFF